MFIKKVGFKAFVYSFACSLSVMLLTGNVALNNHKNKQSQKQTPQNITLFLKNEALAPKIVPVPVKKIVKNDLLPIKLKDDVSNVNLDEVLIRQKELNVAFENNLNINSEIKNVAKTLPETEIIPLDFVENITETKEPEKQTVVASLTNEIVTPAPMLIEKTEKTPEKEQKTEPIHAPLNLAPEENLDTIPLDIGQQKINNNNKIVITDKPSAQKVASLTSAENIGTLKTDKNKPQNTSKTTEKSAWKPMFEVRADKDLWEEAKGNKFAKNKMVLEDTFAQDNKSVQVADAVQNMIIPIPEDLLKDDDLMPNLVSSDQNKKLEEKQPKKEEKTQKKTNVIDKISSMFEEINKQDKNQPKTTKKEEKNPPKIVKNKPKETNFITSKILPTEFRISFQPDKAEISGQTIKWLQAFAQKTINNPSIILEIRMAGTGAFDLQQKRLNLVKKILASKGLNQGRISVVTTPREPNSFVIRTIEVSENKKNFNTYQNNQYMTW